MIKEEKDPAVCCLKDLTWPPKGQRLKWKDGTR